MSGDHEVGGEGRGEAPALDARHRLTTYGSLAPGRPNHHQLDGLEGRWSRGHVRGTLVDAGWGAGSVTRLSSSIQAAPQPHELQHDGPRAR
jgi:hypothetical protein